MVLMRWSCWVGEEEELSADDADGADVCETLGGAMGRKIFGYLRHLRMNRFGLLRKRRECQHALA
jgi:hypothetical protein